jgi:putative NADH-flavin reductase
VVLPAARPLSLLVLGASGGIGRWLTQLAAGRGHRVTALVRPEAPFVAPAGVAVRRGDPTDPATLDAAVAGHDAVLSALGLRRAGLSPWAALRSPPDLTEHVTRNLLPAMRRHGVGRVLVVSAGGVGDSRAQLTWPVRRLVSTGNVAAAYRDLAAMEALLAAGDRDWLAVRPVTLVDGDPRGRARPVGRYALASTVRRADVALWMLDAAARPGPFAERRVLLGG